MTFMDVAKEVRLQASAEVGHPSSSRPLRLVKLVLTDCSLKPDSMRFKLNLVVAGYGSGFLTAAVVDTYTVTMLYGQQEGHFNFKKSQRSLLLQEKSE